MDYKALLPVAQAVASAGFPVLANILGTVLPFPGNLVAKTVLNGIAAAVGAPADDPQAVANAVNTQVANGTPGVSEKLQILQETHENDFKFAQLQMDQNAKELATGSLFISGWRPSFAWLCVFGTAYQMFGAVWWHMHVIPPETWNPIWIAFGGLLGLKSIEKWLGVAPVVEKVAVIPTAVKNIFKRKPH